MRPILCVLIVVLISVHDINAAPQQDAYTALLQDYVQEGKVKYPGLCKDPRLEKYIALLQSTDPENLANDKDRLAFWINAYNAYTLKIVCEHYPVKSINDLHTGGLIVGSLLKKTVWDKEFAVIHNKSFTLNQIEHKIIRPKFKDPRAHFALVCASKSCPALRREAFEGSKLDQQLDEEARIFLSDPKRNRFDTNHKKAYLSKIFDWYGGDFGRNQVEIFIYLSRFLPGDIVAEIEPDPKKWEMNFLDYDWSLNE